MTTTTWTTSAPVAAATDAVRRVGRDRVVLGALLAGTAVLYFWDLTASGYANEFYAAAAQAGSQSWSAFLWGASDAAGSITVDKPPAAIWPMALSVRLFGLSSFAILLPQVLMGIGSVWLVFAGVRRRLGTGPAVLAGVVLALTPVAALMFRFDNPDALLVLLMTAAAYAVQRAIESPSDRRRLGWMALMGALIGLGFLTKQLQAFLVLPGFAAAYLLAAPVPIARRLRDGFVALGALVVAAGWWVALAELVPASARPYIGGSQTNSFLELTFGYNGFGRLTGDEAGSVGGGGGWGQTGLTRLLEGQFGGQIAWLAPAAVVLGAAGLWLRRGRPRTDPTRAMLLLWIGWLVVTWLTFSLMAGIFHEYYTVALAPAIAVLAGLGGGLVWRARAERTWALPLLAGIVLLTTVWAYALLGRSADWQPWLRPVVVVAGVAAAVLLLAAQWRGAALARAGIALAVVAGLLGPAAYTLQTVATPHAGSIVTAGPAVTAAGPGGMVRGGPGGAAGGGAGGGPGGGPPGGVAPGGGTQFGGPPAGQGGGGAVPGGGAMGGLLGGGTASADVTALLLENADDYTWVAATVGAQNAASYQLATEHSVMPIGGFNGSDPSPTLEQFQQDVADGKIHYFIGGGVGGGSEIADWVAENFTAVTVDGVTLYDLGATSGGESIDA
ncbi:mannosyltransferase YkcB-related protein [Jiangella endophytica]|uniref:glycosyltransferase family 39 protein n=1 Tax=Jiangella endophytica TaxID=1623398 RepID=UPI000E356D92|nr:glycosyltransferase family 39 protein [Jiangella endophytica]